MAPDEPPSRPHTLDYRQDAPTAPSKVLQGFVLILVYLAGTISWAAWVGLGLYLLYLFFGSGARR
jgi:hypothetical protein